MLLRGQLPQVSEILQTFWRPGQEKAFIFVQTLYSGGQRGSLRLSQEFLQPPLPYLLYWLKPDCSLPTTRKVSDGQGGVLELYGRELGL